MHTFYAILAYCYCYCKTSNLGPFDTDKLTVVAHKARIQSLFILVLVKHVTALH